MSDINLALKSATQGMRTQGVRMRIISENLANASTTGDRAGADPYQRQVVTFKNEMNRAMGMKTVQVDNIGSDNSEFLLKRDASHPAADENGMVKMPNINPMVEMMDMREAQRSYEAKLGIIDMSKSMLMRTIDLLRA